MGECTRWYDVYLGTVEVGCGFVRGEQDKEVEEVSKEFLIPSLQAVVRLCHLTAPTISVQSGRINTIIEKKAE